MSDTDKLIAVKCVHKLYLEHESIRESIPILNLPEIILISCPFWFVKSFVLLIQVRILLEQFGPWKVMVDYFVFIFYLF